MSPLPLFPRGRLLPVVVLGSALSIGSGCGRAEEPPSAPREASPVAAAEEGSDRRDVPDPARLPPRRSAWVVFGADTVVAEVARTPEERERGLMGRSEIPEGTGMLFVYQQEEILSFWMKDTFVPLDVAFIDAGLTVVHIQEMEPETTEIHSSPRPVMFGLEVPGGWFAARGIRAGDRAELVLGPL